MRGHLYLKGGKFWIYLNEANMNLVQEQNVVAIAFGKLCYNLQR